MTTLLLLATAMLAARPAAAQDDKPLGSNEVVLIGRLLRTMAIGGETTGYTLELRSEAELSGQKVHEIAVAGKAKKLSKLVDQMVKARGVVEKRHTTERGDWLVLKISAIKADVGASAEAGKSKSQQP
ncbi:MAG TPA: hypothetical protein VMT51_14640 [Dongiaceae bacterium]|nr:hypothetical protein [Dongiaceae bacterium]